MGPFSTGLRDTIEDSHPFDWTIFVWKSWLSSVHGKVLRLFLALEFLLFLLFKSHISATGTTFNAFSYDVIWADILTHRLPDDEMVR